MKTLGQQLKNKVFPLTESIKEEDKEIFYKPEVYYEITINPCNAMQHYDQVGRLVATHNDMEVFLRRTFKKKYFKYYFTPEISEPRYSNEKGSFPRIHYHGIFMMKSPTAIVGFLLKTFNKLRESSSIQINTLRPQYWNKYIHKQRSIMEPVLTAGQQPYTLTNMSEKAQGRVFIEDAACSTANDAETPVRSDKTHNLK